MVCGWPHNKKFTFMVPFCCCVVGGRVPSTLECGARDMPSMAHGWQEINACVRTRCRFWQATKACNQEKENTASGSDKNYRDGRKVKPENAQMDGTEWSPTNCFIQIADNNNVSKPGIGFLLPGIVLLDAHSFAPNCSWILVTKVVCLWGGVVRNNWATCKKG